MPEMERQKIYAQGEKNCANVRSILYRENKNRSVLKMDRSGIPLRSRCWMG
jgi:hypothetical protein